MVERKDNRHPVLQIISLQIWITKPDMDGVAWHGIQTACDKRWMMLQIHQELHIFHFDMDIKRGRRKVEKNESATKEAPDRRGRSDSVVKTCFLTIMIS